jgi:hypothetical protein
VKLAIGIEIARAKQLVLKLKRGILALMRDGVAK